MKKPTTNKRCSMLTKDPAALHASQTTRIRRAEEYGDNNDIFWPPDTFQLRSDEPGADGVDPEAIQCVVAAAFEAAASGALRRRLHHGQGLAVIILVPTPFWVAPTSAFFGETFGDRWRLIRPLSVVADRRPTIAEMVVAAELSNGQSVAGVSADVRALPRSLILSADMTIRIEPPSAAVLRAAIRRFTGRAAAEDLLEATDANLDIAEIVACFRPGNGPQRIAQRLAVASALGRKEFCHQNFTANPSACAGTDLKESE